MTDSLTDRASLRGLGPSASAALRRGLAGSLYTPQDPGFAEARRFHAGTGDPAAVARVVGPADVATTLAVARDEGLPVAVRGGGHSMWESVPGAVVIDLAELRSVRVEGTRVRVGGGATWGEVADVLATHGLGISSGDTRSVGVGGLTLGGGIGWMVRDWGLAVDQLVGAQLVTADGQVLEVSADAHPDLFWALRGGGGNFGVVTRFDFEAHPLRAVVHATLAFDETAFGTWLRGFRDVMRAAPRALNGTLFRVPPMDPAAPAGTRLELAWIGEDEAALREAIAPLLALPGLVDARIEVTSYPTILLDRPAPPPGVAAPTIVDANGWFADLDDATLDTLLPALGPSSAPVLLVRWLGGAFADVHPATTAIAFRDAQAFVVAAVPVRPGAEPAEVLATRRALEPISDLALGGYGNFTTSTAPGLVDRMYPPTTLARLRELKRVWDPDNVFSRNHNLHPGGGAS